MFREYYHQYVTRGILHTRATGDAESTREAESLNKHQAKESPLEQERDMDEFVSTFSDYDDLAVQFGA